MANIAKTRSFRRLIWLVVPLALAAGLGERFGLPAWREANLPPGAAKWIWSPELAGQDGWVGFFAVRDLELDQDPSGGTLRIMADRAYRVEVNGSPVGSGEYRRGVLAQYEVGSLLSVGANRIVVELRGDRGVGGLLARLQIDGASPKEVVTDGSWLVVDSYRPELNMAKTGLDDSWLARPAKVWGPPPTGRWGVVRETESLALLPEVVLPGQPTPAQRARVGESAGRWRRISHPEDTSKETAAQSDSTGEIQPPESPEPAELTELVEASERRDAGGVLAPSTPLGNWVTFDFGQEFTGFLELAFSGTGVVEGLVFAGRSIPDPRVERPVTELIKLSGRKSWIDVEVRTFRFVTVVALRPVVGARVFATWPAEAAPDSLLFPQDPPPPGVFGLEPARLGSTVEDEFWREFERVTRAARR